MAEIDDRPSLRDYTKWIGFVQKFVPARARFVSVVRDVFRPPSSVTSRNVCHLGLD